jgi:hypothetical protein
MAGDLHEAIEAAATAVTRVAGGIAMQHPPGNPFVVAAAKSC